MCQRCASHQGQPAGLVSPLLLDGELFPEEIPGANHMDAVPNSLAIPNRWICRLDIDYDITPFGTGERLTTTGLGTGTLIGPCHVLTAAHNLVDYDPVRKNTLRATRIMVTPAHDGSSGPPVAAVEADLSQSPAHRRWDITRRFDAAGAVDNAGEVETNRYDYALLKLRSAIGSRQVQALGCPLGYWGSQGSCGTARFQRLGPTVLSIHPVFVAGYCSDGCVQAARTARANPNIRLGSQLRATGQIRLATEGTGTPYTGRSMAHTADTEHGQSGAPVVLELDGIYYLAGVHTGAMAMTSGGRINHAVRITREVTAQVSDWMGKASGAGAAGAAEDDGSLAAGEEDLALDALDRGGEDETDVGLAGEGPAAWPVEWAGAPGESPPPATSAGAPEQDPAPAGATPPMTAAISAAVDQKDWPRVLALALQVGWRDERRLTDLLFHGRHPELDGRALDPRKNKDDRQLADEWDKILQKEVRSAVRKAAEDRTLEVSGDLVTERDRAFSGPRGAQFKQVVTWAAGEVDIDPAFLAAVLLAEVDAASHYLNPGEVRSFFTGSDDFFEQRANLRANVPAFAQVRFDETKKTTSINEHGRMVTTIPYQTGKDAALATAVYLKWGEIKVRRAMTKNGGDFDTLPTATRFVLVRVAMAAGHGGIGLDGTLIRFKRNGTKLTPVRPGEAGILVGVAPSVDRVLKGEDILIRGWEPRKDPTNDSHVTHRNATILAAQAMHLADWGFRPPALGIQPGR